MSVEDVLTATARWVAQQDQISLYRDYHDGDHRIPFATEAYKQKFRDMLERSQANLCPKIVRNFANLTSVQSWLGKDAVAAERLVAEVPIERAIERAAREAYRTGDGFILAWPNKRGETYPWYHRADQVVYEPDPEDPSDFEWVAKVWQTTDGFGRVNLYYPNEVERWRTKDKIAHLIRRSDDQTGGQAVWPDSADAYVPMDDSEGETIGNPLAEAGGVPWIHMPNDADQDGGRGVSVLHDVIPIQDMLNAFISYMAVNGEQYAAPLRYLLNYLPETFIDPKTGEVTKETLEYDEARRRIFGIEGQGPFGQLDPPDPTPLLRILDAFGSWMARIAGIPPSDIAPDMGNVPAGVSLRILAAERTARVRDFTRDNTPAVTRLLALFGVDAYPVWHDPAPIDDSERQAMAESRHQIGWPLSENMREQGYDPDDIDRVMAALRDQQRDVARAAVEEYRRGNDPAALLRR